MSDTPLLETTALAKSYGAVVALRSASVTVAPGEVHALLGANGAGKSTLVKMLTGVIRPDSGTIRVDGHDAHVSSPRAAKALGIAPVFQDPALLPDLTVAQNLRITGTDPAAVRVALSEMDFPIDFGEEAGRLPLPTLRILDLARALASSPRLLILDEITAALPADLAERVFGVIRRCRDEGRSVLFISHRLAEVREICDTATVLRDGGDVGCLDPRRDGEEQIVRYMLGEAAEAVLGVRAPTTAANVSLDEAPALELRDLHVGTSINGVSLTIRRGEVVGIAALEGQGQDALFEAVAGDRRPSSGSILVAGVARRFATPFSAIRRGVALVPADRQEALLRKRPVRENLSTPLFNRVARWGPIALRDERRRVDGAIERLSIDVRAQRQARRLSGGNQQKLTIGRWLAAGFDCLLCFDPTRGIDVGTKRQIYDLVRELAEQGKAVLLFTSELREIQAACDRVVVLYGGRIVAEMPASEASEETLLHAAHGLEQSTAT